MEKPQNYILKNYLSRFDIQLLVRQAALRINTLLDERARFYNPKETVFICLLRGGIYYFADLTSKLSECNQTDIRLEFLRVHSYTANGQSGELVIEGDIKQFAGKDIWLVDDIVDSGNTMISLVNEFHKLPPEEQPTSIYITSLLMRRSFAESEGMKTLVESPINGLVIPGVVEDDDWLIGYGMEDEGRYRNLRHILKMEKIEPGTQGA